MTFILLLGCVQVVSGEAERGDRVGDDRQQLSCSVVFDELLAPWDISIHRTSRLS